MNAMDPTGNGWISKVGKFIFNKGDVASTVADNAADVRNLADQGASVFSKVASAILRLRKLHLLPRVTKKTDIALLNAQLIVQRAGLTLK